MIRAEIKTVHRSFVFCEDTLTECTDYTRSLITNGVRVLSASYYDKDTREHEIANGTWEEDHGLLERFQRSE